MTFRHPFPNLKRLRLLAVVPLATILAPILQAATPGKYVSMHSDPWIPNFGHADNITTSSVASVQSGDWNDPNTWNGTPPAADQTALIYHDVTFGTSTEVGNVVVFSGGRLAFDTTVPTALTVGTIQVHQGGSLNIGQEGNPVAASVTAEIIFKDRPFDYGIDPAQYGNGLLVFGTVTMHGAGKTPFVRLANEPLSGDNSVQFAQAVSGWQDGDELIVPDTRQTDPRPSRGYLSQTERITATLLAQDGQSATTTPLQHTHLGARDGDGQLDFLPHAANLTRNVILRSANPDGVRGHMQLMMRANVDIRYVRFNDMGRTTAEALDSTTFDAEGNPLHIGTNQVARYPIHTHHLIGPTAPQSNGYQYTLIGNVVDGGTVPRLEKWAITIHGSHDGLIQDNVAVNYTGSNIVTEDGSESYNVFDHNFSIQCPGFGPLGVHDRGLAGTGFWFRGQNNYMRNNIAADHAISGYSINAYRLGNEGTTIPVSQGSTDRQPININTLPLLEFSNNETYGPAFYGADFWEIGSTGETLYDVAPSVIKDLKIWHLRNVGIFFYRSHRIVIDGAVMRGYTPSLSSRFNNPTGISLSSTYRLRNFVIRNADIQGLRTGISQGMRVIPDDIPVGSIFGQAAPQDRPGTLTIEDSYLRNYINIGINTRQKEGSPRLTTIRNVRFDSVNMAPITRLGPQRSISMRYEFRLDTNAIGPDQVLVHDYNGIPGNDFQLFYLEQAPDFMVPQTTNNGRSVGSPVAGLTNLENWNTYGIAIAGEIAPCLNQTTFPEILGFVCPTNTPLPDPDPDPDPEPNPDTEPPTPPTQVLITGVSSESIDLMWVGASDNIAVTGYRLFANGNLLSDQSESVFQHTDLPPATTYVYHVEAYDAAGNTSAPSPETVGTTEAPEPTHGLLQLVARDQFGNVVPTGLFRIAGTLYEHGSELVVEFGTTLSVRPEIPGVLGAWTPITFEPGQTEIAPLFQTVETAASDQSGHFVPHGQVRVSNFSTAFPEGPESTAAFPLGARISVRGQRSGLNGPWNTATVTPELTAIGQLYHTVSSQAVDQFGSSVPDAELEVSSFTETIPTDPGAQLSLPAGIQVNIRGKRHNLRGAWIPARFDSELSQVGQRFWTVDASARDQHGALVLGTLRVSSFTGTVTTHEGATLTVPLGTQASIRAEVSGIRSPWERSTFGPGLSSVGHRFWTIATATRDQNGSPVTGAQLQVSGFYSPIPTAPGSTLSLPADASISVRSGRGSLRGPWNRHAMNAATTDIGNRFQSFAVTAVDANGNLPPAAAITLSGYPDGTLSQGDTATVPLDDTVSLRARIDGQNGSWHSFTIDASTSHIIVPHP